MVNETTLDIVNHAKDLEFEYNIKLLIIITLYVYAIVMLWLSWLSFKVDLDWFWWTILRIIFRVVGLAWIFFLPLFYLMLLRNVSFEVLYLYMVGVYTIAISVVTILFFFGFAEFALRLLGFPISPKRVKMGETLNRRLNK